MDDVTPRIAFNEWLESVIDRLLGTPSGNEEFLGRAVDHADLERRIRVLERGAALPMFR
jgi:hypothetical protein